MEVAVLTLREMITGQWPIVGLGGGQHSLSGIDGY